MSLHACPSGALPARFRRTRILIVGCGDVGTRVVRHAGHKGVHLIALSSDPEKAATLRSMGLQVLRGNLDQPQTLQRLAGWAHRVLHLAPPPADQEQWWLDHRTRALVRVLRRRSAPRMLVYGSTSGVYGNQQGRWVDEATPVQPHTPRAERRLDAENALRQWGAACGGGPTIGILRIPGIYAPDRPGGTPRERLQRRTPVLARADDVYTNHVHADDLARACWLALWRARPQRVYNVNDDSVSKMGDYFDMAADLYGMPRPPRLPLHAARDALPLTLLSFMQESRRMHNQRAKRELRWRLQYPTPAQGLLEQKQGRLF